MPPCSLLARHGFPHIFQEHDFVRFPRIGIRNRRGLGSEVGPQKGNKLSLWRIFQTSEMFSRLCPRICGVFTTSWCTSMNASREYCTPHPWCANFVFTATLARASRGNCPRAQNSSVWLYLSRCVTARKIPLCGGGLSHHGHAYQEPRAEGR